MKKSPSLSYAAAGVSIDAGNQLVENIKTLAKNTHSPAVLGGIGGFASLYALPKGMEAPVLVSCTDGVGTKLKLAIEAEQHDTIGQDLVAMCVNDLVVCGAQPLFFLDYYACSALSEHAATIIAGIAKGCELGGLALIGGETAEMPGMYQGQDYDLAGFCVGVVDQANIIDGRTITPGDVIIGLPASGPHANGYSLIRHVLNTHQIDVHQPFGAQSLLSHLLTPTRIYTKSVQALTATGMMKGAAHITGGGLIENIPRILPDYLQAEINRQAWQIPEIFHWLAETGPIDSTDLWRTFNMGIGMTLIVSPEHVDEALMVLTEAGESPCVIGQIKAQTSAAPQVTWQDASK